mmetsp:Transcript_128068/g.239695  ORF Transcript_128068/g.239695 Transcript_128068/m.239695 type:complete len:472 (-) Transcript_128068:347-1762(-)
MPDNEAGVPEGDYLQSCNGCKLQADDDELYCSHCMKSCGARVMAIMYDVKKCKVDNGAKIYNFDGSLVCEDPLPENDGGIPDGSYQFSCYGCSMIEMNLTCTACLDEARGRHHTTIPLAGCTSFGNLAGKLQCDELERKLSWMLEDSSTSTGDSQAADPGYIDPHDVDSHQIHDDLNHSPSSPDSEGDASHYQDHDEDGMSPDHLAEQDAALHQEDDVHEVPLGGDTIEPSDLEESGEGAPGEDVEMKPKRRKKRVEPSPWEYDTPDGRRAARKMAKEQELMSGAEGDAENPGETPEMDSGLEPPITSDGSDDLAPDPVTEQSIDSNFQDDLGPEPLPEQGADENSDTQPDDSGSSETPPPGMEDYNSDIVPEDLGPAETPPSGMEDYNSDIVPEDLEGSGMQDYNSDIAPDDLAPPPGMEDYNSDIVPDDLEPPPGMEDYNSDIVPEDLEGSEGADSTISMPIVRDHSEL